MQTSPGYNDPDFITTIANLGNFSAGDTLQVRFTAAYDTNTRNGTPSWVIDNVSVQSTAIPEPSTLVLGGLGLLGLLGTHSWRRRQTRHV